MARVTARQLELLQLIADGLTRREVAAAMVVQPSCVSQHLKRLKWKFRVQTSEAVLVEALRLGLVKV